jgi:hypothetical protein
MVNKNILVQCYNGFMESPYTQESAAEKVLLSAMRYRGKVYTGIAHGIIFTEIQTEYPEAVRGEEGGVEEGFTTTLRPFVDRVEAKKIALVAGQAQENERPELYSDELEHLQQ